MKNTHANITIIKTHALLEILHCTIIVYTNEIEFHNIYMASNDDCLIREESHRDIFFKSFRIYE
jgi:hypothetical protein